MNLLLSLVPLILMFTLVPTMFASCYKLSAYLLRRRVVSWKQCFTFALLLVFMSIIVNVLINVGGMRLSPVIGIFVAFILQIGLGAWFFSHRSTYADGQQLGWRGGAELAALSFIFIAAIGFVLFTGTNYLRTLL